MRLMNFAKSPHRHCTSLLPSRMGSRRRRGPTSRPTLEPLEDRLPLSAFFIERVSVANDGAEGNGPHASGGGLLSADGRFVGFTSMAINLVAGDTNGLRDGFLRDRQTRQTLRVTIAADGSQGNADLGLASISADGRFAAFHSHATNIVPGDTNGQADIFVRDVQTGAVTRASVSSTGQQANGESNEAAFSGDGRHVAFWSRASNLVPGDTNGQVDIFRHDRLTGETVRISVASDGAQAGGVHPLPSEPFNVVGHGGMSADGRWIAFTSYASNLVPGDTNGSADIFVRDVLTGQTTRVNVASDGTQANAGRDPRFILSTGHDPQISADGRFVAFASAASDLVPGDTNGTWDLFVHNRLTGQTVRASLASDGTQANEASANPGHGISGDGRFVAFLSGASNLVPGDTNGFSDVLVRDMVTGQIVRVSVAADQTQGSAHAGHSVRITPDGRYILFGSHASNLVPGDTNGSNSSQGFDYFLVPNPLAFLPVQIDIKPGSFPNSINLGSNGTVPVAIFSTAAFDATTVDPTTVTLANAGVQLRGNGTPIASAQDVNGDGRLDLVVHVSTEALQLTSGDVEAVLEGRTFSGQRIRGTDSVRIVSGLLANAVGPASASTALSQEQTWPLLVEALRRWHAAGLDTSGLGTVATRIEDLPDTFLGQTGAGVLWLDNNAAGWEWFIDPTPWQDAEFMTPGNQGEEGRMDLLSVLSHEVGHMLGFAHADDADVFMAETLAPGVRRLPVPGPAAAEIAALDFVFRSAANDLTERLAVNHAGPTVGRVESGAENVTSFGRARGLSLAISPRILAKPTKDGILGDDDWPADMASATDPALLVPLL